METGERNSVGDEDDDVNEAKEGERKRKRAKRERLIWSPAVSHSRGHSGLLGECEWTELIQISAHHLFKYVILYQRTTGESWPKHYCRGISSGSWITGNWKAVFAKWRSDFRFSLSLPLKGSPSECILWQTSVWIMKMLHSLHVCLLDVLDP